MNSQLPNNIEKYLRKYSYDKWKISSSNKNFESVIVIPAIDEYDNIKTLLSSLVQNETEYFLTTLILFVVNHQASSNTNVKQNNLKTIEYLKCIIDKKNSKDDLSQMVIDSNMQIGLIDASSEGLELDEKDGGVGFARKIGMDEALKVFDYNSAQKKILICLDADCTVSENYISTIRYAFNKTSINAGYVNFTHVKTDDEENYKAIINYEIFLRYYVLGLKYANSPYGYHSIGSTMVCDVESYMKIQGMNKRKAAEDFYFMEKLSKITDIKKIEGTTVSLQAVVRGGFHLGQGKESHDFLKKSKMNIYCIHRNHL